MYCNNCGAKIEKTARYCSCCGKQVYCDKTEDKSDSKVEYTRPNTNYYSPAQQKEESVSGHRATKASKKKPNAFIVALLVLACVLGVVVRVVAESGEHAEPEMVVSESFVAEEKTEEEPLVEDMPADNVTAEWEGQFSETLAEEIKAAFEEIGENPDNIVSIEYYDARETDLFDRRDYIVEFSDDRQSIGEVLDFDKIGWVHNNNYLITTEEWHDGEPEKEVCPEEYLVTIKFWDGEDHLTNINQWTHTGEGVLQESDAGTFSEAHMNN